jgi:hypothetical protein
MATGPHEPRRPHTERVRSPVHTGPQPDRILVMSESTQGARSVGLGDAVQNASDRALKGSAQKGNLDDLKN